MCSECEVWRPPRRTTVWGQLLLTWDERAPGHCVFKVRDVRQLTQPGSDPGGGHHNVAHLQDEETIQDPGY